MNNKDNIIIRPGYSRHHSLPLVFISLILFFASCISKPEPYSIIEFSGEEMISNYSKSFQLMIFESDSLNPIAVPASPGDMFGWDNIVFVYNDTSSKNTFRFKTVDNVVYVNDRISSIDIPDNDDMIPWFEKMKEKDLSALQFINFKSDIKESYLPYLAELAKTKSDAGLIYSGDFDELAGLLKIFDPRYIAGPALSGSDSDQLSMLNNLEILMVSLNDSIIVDPLPTMPELKQLFLTDIKKNVALTNDFLVNNKQIEKVIIQKEGRLDLTLLNPLEHLKELVVNGPDEIKNPELINNHKNLEVLSLTGDNLVYNPGLIKLPNLRWMAFSSNVTQQEFSSFAGYYPNLEMIEIVKNDTITSLQPLTKFRKLYGLIVIDTLTDISTIKTLTNLKYLSLPVDLLNDTLKKAELQNSLPGTRIVANEGFCLGSGWLLLIIPFVLILRFFGRQKRERLQDGIKS
jgi:hypothetical protein